jgi:3-deoxy-D-manno-octulosonate 8-phosphate phosphatase (KDO 8-P phosphatase)
MARNKKFKKGVKPKYLVFDVDGVFTTGPFLYTVEGKFAKIFGPHDNDGIKIIRKKIKIRAVSADKRGFGISKKRIQQDMKIPLSLIDEANRLNWFKNTFKNLKEVIYMGDGIHDAEIFNVVGYSIAPSNAFYTTRNKADFVTKSRSGEGAVAEACLHVLEKFFAKLPE